MGSFARMADPPVRDSRCSTPTTFVESIENSARSWLGTRIRGGRVRLFLFWDTGQHRKWANGGQCYFRHRRRYLAQPKSTTEAQRDRENLFPSSDPESELHPIASDMFYRSLLPMTPAQSQHRFLVLLNFGLVYLFWGSTYLGIRIAVEHIPPALMCGIRFFTAGVLMLAYCGLTGRKITYSGGDLARMATVGILLLMGGNLTLSYAERIVPTGLS